MGVVFAGVCGVEFFSGAAGRSAGAADAGESSEMVEVCAELLGGERGGRDLRVPDRDIFVGSDQRLGLRAPGGGGTDGG